MDVGAGPHSVAEFQMDIHRYPNTTIVQDAAMEVWKFPDNFFDEVRMEMFLEHCPVSIRVPNIGELGIINGWATHYCRIHCMKEAYRVLKHGGILHVSVPGVPATHSQDPTHEGPQITDGFFNYFIGEWGGAEPGSFSNDSYGIDFKFKKLSYENDGFSLTARFTKE